MNTRLPTILGASLFLAVPAIAQVIATDTFELIDHPTGDRTFVTGGINGIKFYTRNATPTDLTVNIVNDAGGLGTNVLSLMDTANTTTLNDSIIGVLSQPITLAAQGDFIRLEFTFRYTNVGTAAANAAGFRFGIENSNGTPVTADNQTSISDNDQGYYAQTGVGTVAPLSTNTLYRESGGTLPILGGIDRTNLATNSAGAAFNDNNAHTVSFSITRTAGNNISLSLIYDGGTPITNTTTSGTGNFFTFDEIAFSNGFVTSPVSFNLDNITITSVPEPATMGLTSFGAVGMLGLVRGRRR